MKKIITSVFLLAFAVLMLHGGVKAANEPVACTMEYAPVCAKVQVQCVTTPCEPVYETFGNACTMNANKNATFAYNGECKEWVRIWELYLYNKMSTFLDNSYFVWQFTPLQAVNYTQWIITKIDNKLQVSKMKQWSYNKHLQLKRWLQAYITAKTVLQ